MRKGFRGTYTVMITPFDEHQNVNVQALRDHTEWQIQQGIHGLIPLGSTGEFLSMTEDEKALVAETVIHDTWPDNHCLRLLFFVTCFFQIVLNPYIS